MGIIIDGFSHILPKLFAEALMKKYPSNELKMISELPYFGDIENRIRVLDKYNIEKQVLTLARPNIWIGMPKDIALKMVKIANDTVLKDAKSFPDRLIPVGTLPMLDEEFESEFDRCIKELEMMGIQVFSNIEGKYLDDFNFRWFFSKANEMKIPIWIHPQARKEWSEEFALDKILGWPFETSLVMSRLVFSGIMEKYSNLRIITHHMGGMISFFSERIRGSYEGRDLFTDAKFLSLPKDPLEYFKKFYVDTVLNGAQHAFECGYKFFGADHIIFATDYPFGPKKGERWIESALNQIFKTELQKEEKEKILSKNVQKLIARL
jgi:aminocarboxymuconate-semialdehyde decarboxylase